MSIHVRNKGHNGEREMCTKLTKDLGLAERLDRNVDQVRDGGGDIMSLRPFAIEIKRQERLLIKQWWKQALSQTTKKNPIPVLMHRVNRGQWRVVVPASLVLKKKFTFGAETVEIDYPTFVAVAKTLHKNKTVKR